MTLSALDDFIVAKQLCHTLTSTRTSCSSTVSLACVSAAESPPFTSSSSPSVWSSHSLNAARRRSNSILRSARSESTTRGAERLRSSPADGLVTANDTASMPLRDTVTVCEPDADVDTISSTPELAICRHRQTSLQTDVVAGRHERCYLYFYLFIYLLYLFLQLSDLHVLFMFLDHR